MHKLKPETTAEQRYTFAFPHVCKVVDWLLLLAIVLVAKVIVSSAGIMGSETGVAPHNAGPSLGIGATKVSAPRLLGRLWTQQAVRNLTYWVDINIRRSVSQVVPFATTIEVRDTCLCLHAQRAARALARRFDAALRPIGLTNGQFSLLMSLNRPAPPPMAPVARLLATDRTTLTAALKPLERRGFVEVQVDPADKRGRLLALTDAGREVVARAVPVWRATHQDVESGLIDPDTLRRELIALA